MRWLIAITGLLFAATSGAVNAADAGVHGIWNELVARHVRWNAEGTASRVDYAGFARDAGALSNYLEELSRIEPGAFERWARDDREALLINAYNAATVQLVLTRYPDLESIRELGGLFSSPWKKRFVELLGRRRSLDEIEHELLRGADDHEDPRIHFAVNCASVGCPALRDEAYTGASLKYQLQDQTRRFLSDRTRNHLGNDGDTLVVSRIFDWYAKDFSASAGSVTAFLAQYGDALDLDSGMTVKLKNGSLRIRFSEYDWSLNALQRGQKSD
ncbi:DUF547 domain-containing protein [Dokdonella sp.]|uniref:DUF547 domain-containing protein n=1 Tax=Dokdonella sp. TaxID=2291710 RepID=UPI0035275E31